MIIPNLVMKRRDRNLQPPVGSEAKSDEQTAANTRDPTAPAAAD